MTGESANRVICPECGHEFDVSEVLRHQLDEQIRREYAEKRAEEEKVIRERERVVAEAREKLENDQKTLEKRVAEDVDRRLRTERDVIRKEARKEADEARAKQVAELEKELGEKSAQVQELHASKAEIGRLKREKDELHSRITAELEEKLSEQIKEESVKARKEAEERVELRLKEKETLIETLNDQLKEAQRRAAVGSSQSRGEVQELAIEAWLRDTFPLDTIDEVKKGALGADCLQTVNTREEADCGTIYYESKRTKAFQPAWIEKFKNDMRSRGAHIGVLVTETMPADMDRMGQRDGVWICTYEEFKGLSAVLRDTVVRVNHAMAIQENRGTKMEMLYGYLSGLEFRQQLEAIVEGFTQMREDLEKEKRSMQSQWSKREKAIEKVILNTTNMYGSIRGIAGSAVQPVKALEFDEIEDAENDDSVGKLDFGDSGSRGNTG